MHNNIYIEASYLDQVLLAAFTFDPLALFNFLLISTFARFEWLSDIGLHLFSLLLLVHSLCDLSQLLHELLFEVLGAGVVVDYLFLQVSELIVELFDGILSEAACIVPFLNCFHEVVEVHCQHFKKVLFESFIFSQSEIEGVLSFFEFLNKGNNYMEIGECVDPFQFFTAFHCEFKCVLHVLTFSKVDVQCLEKVFPHSKDISILVLVSCSLTIDVTLCTVIHSLHYFLLSIYHVIWLFPEDMTLEVVFVIRLPGLRTHVTKVFATFAGHEVAPHRPLYCFFARRTYFGILGDPFGISLLLDYLIHPFGLFLTLAWIMVIALAGKAEYFAAITCHCFQSSVHFNAVSAIHSCTELIASVSSDEMLAQFLLVFLQPNSSLSSVLFQQSSDCLQEHWPPALTIHAFGESRTEDKAFEVAHPAVQTVPMTTDVLVELHFLQIAHIACAFNLSIEVIRAIQSQLKSCSLHILLILVIKLLPQIVFVPFEVLEKDETPALGQIHKTLNLLEDLIQLQKKLCEGQYLKGLFLHRCGKYFIHLRMMV